MAPRSLPASELARLQARYPQAFGDTLVVRTLRTGVMVAGVAYLFYLAVKLGLISEGFLSGLGKTGVIIGAMWPPAPDSWGSFEIILVKLGETVGMAFLGTLIASLIALPLGFLGAKTVMAAPTLHFVIRRCFDFLRGMPALIWALVFVRAVGLGPMTGVLAFAMADFPALAKLNAEAIDTEHKSLSWSRGTMCNVCAATVMLCNKRCKA